MKLGFHASLVIVHLILIFSVSPACLARTKAPQPQSAPATAPASQPASAPTSQATVDPFAQLKVVTPRAALPPIRSIRVRDKQEEKDRSRKDTVTITIGSSPKGAVVLYGGKLLGRTPLSLRATRGSTPYDVTIRKKGYMTLHTRVRRKRNRGYFYKLAPAKIR
jgi:hypothetical protein